LMYLPVELILVGLVRLIVPHNHLIVFIGD
jgi:hypothetical protein